jgi:proteic killer suppression protein
VAVDPVVQKHDRRDGLSGPLPEGLHALKDDRQGQHSISVNMKFRICFFWTEQGPEQVEFVDYH